MLAPLLPHTLLFGYVTTLPFIRFVPVVVTDGAVDLIPVIRYIHIVVVGNSDIPFVLIGDLLIAVVLRCCSFRRFPALLGVTDCGLTTITVFVNFID